MLWQLTVQLFELSGLGSVVNLPGQSRRVEDFLEDQLKAHFMLQNRLFVELDVLAQSVLENEMVLLKKFKNFVFAHQIFVGLEGLGDFENREFELVRRA